MPVERHAERINRPLGRRELRVLAVVAVVVVVATTIAVVLAVSRSHPTRQDCIVVPVASTMGGATLRTCGTAARSFCRAQSFRDAEIATICRERDLPTRRLP